MPISWPEEFCVKILKFTLSNILVHWWEGFFRYCNVPLHMQIQFLQQKVFKGAEFIVLRIRGQLHCKRVQFNMNLVNYKRL